MTRFYEDPTGWTKASRFNQSLDRLLEWWVKVDKDLVKKVAIKTAQVTAASVVILSSQYNVPLNTRAVVYRFGEEVAISGPGFHAKIPFIEGSSVYETTIQSSSKGYDRENVNFTSSDGYVIRLAETVYWQEIDDDTIAWRWKNVRNTSSKLDIIVLDTLSQIISSQTLAQTLSNREAIRQQVKDRVTVEALELYRVKVTDFRIPWFTHNKPVVAD